ncbi:MAG: alanine racemase [Coriobacteriales bacterium]
MSSDEVNYFSANPNISGAFEKLNEKDNEERLQDSSPDDIQIPAGFEDGVPRSYELDELPRDAWVEIDLDAIAHNVRIARRHLGPSRHLMAVVKADGYGHGAIPVAKTALANGADHLAVSTVEEGVELRQAGIEAPILILSQPPISAIPLLLHFNIMPTVTTSEFALALGEAADRQGMVAKYHLALDTGMNRIGVFYLDAVDFLQSINFHRGIMLAGTFTHFATADEGSDWDFKIQLERFQEAIQMMRNARIDPGIVHCANSASIERYPESYFDMGRVGITMYGLAPSPYLRENERLIPAMSVKARVTYVKEPQMGEGVSYGFKYRVAKPVQIATVPLGYADGVRRNLSGRMKVLCHGYPCLQVGSICMDQMMIEIPTRDFWRFGQEGVQIGDEVVIIGHQGNLEVTADMMADEIGTINYEIVCGFGMRLPRVYVHSNE